MTQFYKFFIDNLSKMSNTNLHFSSFFLKKIIVSFFLFSLEGIETIRKYLKHFAPGFTSNECNIIPKLLKLVMENWVFKFGETLWLQLIGTAMGTPVACNLCYTVLCVLRANYPISQI